jgi:acyl-CoA oxidase
MEKILSEERARSGLCPNALGAFLYGSEYYTSMKRYLESAPVLDYTPNLYNKSRLELVKDAYRYLPLIYNFNTANGHKVHPHLMSIYSALVNPHQIPGMAHFGMFIKYIELMGTPEHQQLYLQKAISCEIIGCYAQTELGHGSDIRSL